MSNGEPKVHSENNKPENKGSSFMSILRDMIAKSKESATFEFDSFCENMDWNMLLLGRHNRRETNASESRESSYSNSSDTYSDNQKYVYVKDAATQTDGHFIFSHPTEIVTHPGDVALSHNEDINKESAYVKKRMHPSDNDIRPFKFARPESSSSTIRLKKPIYDNSYYLSSSDSESNGHDGNHTTHTEIIDLPKDISDDIERSTLTEEGSLQNDTYTSTFESPITPMEYSSPKRTQDIVKGAIPVKKLSLQLERTLSPRHPSMQHTIQTSNRVSMTTDDRFPTTNKTYSLGKVSMGTSDSIKRVSMVTTDDSVSRISMVSCSNSDDEFTSELSVSEEERVEKLEKTVGNIQSQINTIVTPSNTIPDLNRSRNETISSTLNETILLSPIPMNSQPKRKESPSDKHRIHMRQLLEMIPMVKLKTTDTIEGPDGVTRPNPVWIEMYGRQ